MMRFREATTADVPALAQMNWQLIRDEGHRNPMSVAELSERMDAWLQGDYRAVLLEDSDDQPAKDGRPAPIGYALYRHDPDFVYLRQFYVTSDQRHGGIGRAAIEWLCQHAWLGNRRVRLEVLTGNTAAIEFWRAVGFTDYAITMERPLSV